jgi:hypothetical protein
MAVQQLDWGQMPQRLSKSISGTMRNGKEQPHMQLCMKLSCIDIPTSKDSQRYATNSTFKISIVSSHFAILGFQLGIQVAQPAD